jgi:hypothetical protein
MTESIVLNTPRGDKQVFLPIEIGLPSEHRSFVHFGWLNLVVDTKNVYWMFMMVPYVILNNLHG